MTTYQLILSGIIIFLLVFVLAIYAMKHAKEVDPNDETF